jgi:two-component system chemotaxis response regulator CheY
VKVLIVEDSRAMQAILARIVESLGNVTTVKAAHGGEALSQIAAAAGDPFTLALIDWNMPEMNGLALVQAIRLRPELNAMKIIMVTTETEMNNVSQALNAGADEYVMKPFNKDDLREKIKILGLIA